MELPVTDQLAELAKALILGFLLGFCYDLIRPLRRGRASTACTDLLFCLLTLAALLAFTIYGGRGRLRIFGILGICLGAAGYFVLLSKGVVRLENSLIRIISAPARFLGGKLKKSLKKRKKTVANDEKTGKIDKKHKKGKFVHHVRRKHRQTISGKGGCRVKLKKTSLLTKLLILAVAIYALVTLVKLQDRISAVHEEVNRLEEQVLYAEQEYAVVEQDLADLGTDQSVKKIARNRLGMVEAGEIVFFDADVQD